MKPRRELCSSAIENNRENCPSVYQYNSWHKKCAFMVACGQKMIKIQYKGYIYIYIFCCLSDTSNFQWFVIWIAWINDIWCRKGAVLVCECDVSSLKHALVLSTVTSCESFYKEVKGRFQERISRTLTDEQSHSVPQKALIQTTARWLLSFSAQHAQSYG